MSVQEDIHRLARRAAPAIARQRELAECRRAEVLARARAAKSREGWKAADERAAARKRRKTQGVEDIKRRTLERIARRNRKQTP